MAAIILILTTIIMAALIPESHGWGYRASDQRRWSAFHPACGGRQQSPIPVMARTSIPITIPGIEFVGFQNALPGPIVVANNGHSVTVTVPKYVSEEQKRGFHLPYIFSGPLDDEYEFEGFSFHWGDKNNRGSEHTLNDMRLPLEVHMIHRNKKYNKLGEALQHPDGLCIMALLFKVVEYEAQNLAPIVRNITALERSNTSMMLTETFSLASILSGLNRECFYTYKGSLTTPPCTEAVTWIIFCDVLPISVYHMDNFRTLLSNTNLPLVDNYRQLQPLFGRRVFSRINSNSPKFSNNHLHYSKLNLMRNSQRENEVRDYDE